MAVVADPLYPIPDEEVTLSATATTGNVVVWELTSVPSASELATGLLYAVQASGVRYTSAQAIIEADTQSDAFTPDVAGEYSFKLYDFARYEAFAGYEGAPTSKRRHQLLGSQTGTVHVGEHVDLPIVTEQGGHGATLRLQVNNETVRDADIVLPLDEISRIAALDTTVAAAVAALVGVAISSVGTDLQTGVNDLRTRFIAHLTYTTSSAHNGAGDLATVVEVFPANSQRGAIALLNELRTKLDMHMASLESGSRHHTFDDLKNVAVSKPASDLASATVLLADLRERVYERHRVQIASPTAHGSADNTNALAAPSVLDTAIIEYLDALVALDPSSVAGEAEGARDAGHRYGFAKSRV